MILPIIAIAAVTFTVLAQSTQPDTCVSVRSGQEGLYYPCNAKTYQFQDPSTLEGSPLSRQIHCKEHETDLLEFLDYYDKLPEDIFFEDRHHIFYHVFYNKAVITINSQEAFEDHQDEFTKRFALFVDRLLIDNPGPITNVNLQSIKISDAGNLGTLVFYKDPESDNILIQIERDEPDKGCEILESKIILSLREHFEIKE